MITGISALGKQLELLLYQLVMQKVPVCMTMKIIDIKECHVLMRLVFPSSFHNIQLSLSSSQNTDMPHEVHLKELISMSMT